MYQEPELNVEEKSNASVNKRLYKLLIMSKIQACDYLGVSRATFDNYVRDGFIPKGIKQEGFKELSWQKSDLDIFLSSK